MCCSQHTFLAACHQRSSKSRMRSADRLLASSLCTRKGTEQLWAYRQKSGTSTTDLMTVTHSHPHIKQSLKSAADWFGPKNTEREAPADPAFPKHLTIRNKKQVCAASSWQLHVLTRACVTLPTCPVRRARTKYLGCHPSSGLYTLQLDPGYPGLHGCLATPALHGCQFLHLLLLRRHQPLLLPQWPCVGAVAGTASCCSVTHDCSLQAALAAPPRFWKTSL